MFAPGIAPGLTPGGSFTPVRLPGLVSWLRSDLGVTLASGKVSAWADQSPVRTNGVSQGTAAQQPTYVASGGANGLPYLNCGISAMSQLNFPTSCFSALTAAEVFVVFNNATDPPLGSAAGTPFTMGFSGGQTLVPYRTNTVYGAFGSTTQKSALGPTGGITASTFLYNVASSASEWTERHNGTLFYTTATNAVAFDAAQWLLSLNLGNWLVGRFYEFIMFNRVLSAGERALVNQYVYKRYGIAGA